MNGRTPVSDSAIDRLREISHWVSSVLDLDKLLELIIDTATKMMQAKASSLLLLDPKTKSFISRSPSGKGRKKSESTRSIWGRGSRGWSLKPENLS